MRKQWSWMVATKDNNKKKYVSGMHQSIPDLTQIQSLSIDCFNLES